MQYGVVVKAHAVYLSQYQLLPYNPIEEYFAEQLSIPDLVYPTGHFINRI